MQKLYCSIDFTVQFQILLYSSTLHYLNNWVHNFKSIAGETASHKQGYKNHFFNYCIYRQEVSSKIKLTN